MNELWSRSLANIHDGKLEEFKRLAQDLVSAIRENDSEALTRSSLTSPRASP
jgi:hypothetical protein